MFFTFYQKQDIFPVLAEDNINSQISRFPGSCRNHVTVAAAAASRRCSAGNKADVESDAIVE